MFGVNEIKLRVHQNLYYNEPVAKINCFQIRFKSIRSSGSLIYANITPSASPTYYRLHFFTKMLM